MKQIPRLLLALCVVMSAGEPALARSGEAAPPVPSGIAVPTGNAVEVKLAATGVQIYRCRPAAQAGNSPVWTFIAPEATLFESDGKVAGRHYAGPTWEANDGSKILGKVAGRAAAPDGASIPWLLLASTVATAGPTLGKIGFIQRVNTKGGAEPAPNCAGSAIDAEVRVPYTADYYFFAPE